MTGLSFALAFLAFAAAGSRQAPAALTASPLRPAAPRPEGSLSALSTWAAGVVYQVQAGRVVTAQRTGSTSGEMLKLRGLFEAAEQKLAASLGGR